ncbi:MAG: pitrilysin family protein [Acidobacteriota bacterium]
MGADPVLIVEEAPGAATAALGVWLRGGSAQEPLELSGITHLIEHLLLRRSTRREPEAIAELIDSMGGAVDAFTTRETLAITAHVPANRFDEALDLLVEALFEPRFVAEELEIERGVVAAEFDLVQDSPAEVAAEHALLACWGGHPLARPVLGRREVVRRLTVRELKRFHTERFAAPGLVLVAVGPVHEAEIARRLRQLPDGRFRPRALPAPAWQSGFVVDERDGLEQVYANLVLPALPANHPEMAPLGALQQLLGEGNSSRLFRELRDRLGLVYDVGASVYSTSRAGVLEITFSCPLRHAAICWDAVLRVLEEVARGGITDREVELAREALLSGLLLGTEGTYALMDAHAGEHLARGRRFDAEQVRGELRAITPERVRALASDLVVLDQLAGAVCGPHGGALLPASLPRRVA